MKTKPEITNLVWAFVGIGAGFIYILIGEYLSAVWPLSAALAYIRVYQIEAWHFEIEEDEDDDGDEWKSGDEPVPSAPADDADWWKGGRK